MDTETKKLKKKLDIFIKRLIKQVNVCNTLLKSSIERSDGYVVFSGELYVDVYNNSRKLYTAATKYSKLSNQIRQLSNMVHSLINKMEHQKLLVLNDGYKDTIAVPYEIKGCVINVSKHSDVCLYEIASMFPIEGHKYLVGDKEED